ncbi:MAG: hypothetical protein ACYTGH_14425, partial [Planctomycetota bacterium]
ALEALAAEGVELPSPTSAIVYQDDNQGKPADAQLAAFLECIEEKKKPEISAAGSMPSLRTIWALYEAEEKGIVADLSGIEC